MNLLKKLVSSNEKKTYKQKKLVVSNNNSKKMKQTKDKKTTIKAEKPTNNSKTLKVNDIKMNKFYLPKILIPKTYYACFNKNKENTLDIKDLHFKFIKSYLNLPKLNKHIKIHEKYIKDNTKLEDSLGKNKDKIISMMSYDNFTSNKKIGYFPKKIYNIDLNCGWTNAWRKMYEMLEKGRLIDPTKPIENYTHFDICGFPGAFIFATNHYIKTRTKVKEYDWYIQSYNEKKTDEELTYLRDQYKLHNAHPHRFLYGSIKSGYNGDITNVDNIREYIKIFKDKEVDLVTSDCGLNIDYGKSYNRETQMIKIHFGQFVCGIALLKKGGSFVMKNYSQMKPFSISIIYLMTKIFKVVELVKPESSRNYGNEIYLVCKNYYKNLDSKQIDELLKILDSMDNEKHIDYVFLDKKNIDFRLINRIENILNIYYNKLHQIKQMKTEVFKKEIISLKNKPELIIPKVKHMNMSTEGMIRYYFSNYFKKMKYRRIQNKDKLS